MTTDAECGNQSHRRSQSPRAYSRNNRATHPALTPVLVQMNVDERQDTKQPVIVARVVEEAELHTVQLFGVVVHADREPELLPFDSVVSGNRHTVQVPGPGADRRYGEALN